MPKLMGLRTLIRNYMANIRDLSLPQIWNMAKYRLTPADSTYLFYKPFKLLMHITAKCNYSCLFCFDNAPSASKDFFNFEDMSFGNFVQIVNEFKGATSLRISGGEPFLNKDIFKMIEFANSKNMVVDASTNGSILHDKIDKIVSSPLSALNISVNADNSLEYEKIHGMNTFNTVLKNISELVEKRGIRTRPLTLTMSHVTTKKNYKRIPNMIHLAERLGVDSLAFFTMTSIELPGYPKDQSLYVDDSEVIEIIENIDPPNSKLKISMPRLFRSFNITRQCSEPFTTVPIYGNGNTSICCAINPRKEFGNVLRNKNVWNNLYFQRIRKIMLDDSIPMPELCKNCNKMYHPYKVLVGK